MATSTQLQKAVSGSAFRERCAALVCRAFQAGIIAVLACDQAPSDAPTLDDMVQQVFQPSCVFATCHKRPGVGGLQLEVDIEAELLGVAAKGAPDRIRVVPGEPEASYLLEKLTAKMPAAGDQMPPGAPLEPDRIELVRRWIANGAAID